MTNGPLTPELLAKIDAYWRAANYLSVGQIYLLDNPLLREPLSLQYVKPRLLGHWGTTPFLSARSLLKYESVPRVELLLLRRVDQADAGTRSAPLV